MCYIFEEKNLTYYTAPVWSDDDDEMCTKGFEDSISGGTGVGGRRGYKTIFWGIFFPWEATTKNNELLRKNGVYCKKKPTPDFQNHRSILL